MTGFTKIPLVTAGEKILKADGITVASKPTETFEAPDGSVGMFFTFDDIDAMKVAADHERDLQAKFARTGMGVVR